jgi:hypothetical protein
MAANGRANWSWLIAAPTSRQVGKSAGRQVVASYSLLAISHSLPFSVAANSRSNIGSLVIGLSPHWSLVHWSFAPLVIEPLVIGHCAIGHFSA